MTKLIRAPNAHTTTTHAQEAGAQDPRTHDRLIMLIAEMIKAEARDGGLEIPANDAAIIRKWLDGCADDIAYLVTEVMWAVKDNPAAIFELAARPMVTDVH